MNVEEITAHFIERLLKSWHTAEFSPEDLLTINLWDSAILPAQEQRLLLRDLLYSQVLEELPPNFIRAIEKEQTETLLNPVTAVFQDDTRNEQCFSLIYCRYLSLKKYTVGDLANHVGISVRTLRRYLVSGFEMLTLKMQNEQQNSVQTRQTGMPEAHLPLFNLEQVVGVDAFIGQLAEWLSKEVQPHAISIEGIGGIGKTILAKHLLKRLHEQNQFDGFAWISARQKDILLSGKLLPLEDFASTLDDIAARLANQLGQTHLSGFPTQKKLEELRAFANKKRLLIIVDNLETVEDIDNIVPELLKLTGFSKILFTSRQSVSQYPAVRTFPVPELSLENSRQLVLDEMQRNGLALSISDKSIADLYQVCGGLPLALKLIAAQFGYFPVEEIVGHLLKGENNTQAMYTHIYYQAWQFLDDIAKRFLLSMLMVSPDGEEREWICETGELSAEEFNQGLEQLKRLSLIEFSGTIEMPLYRIHRLTNTFLHTNILQNWEEHEGP